ncbi:helix-turn-helix domain-containing protein [Pseudovibrio sp. Ad26]|uniref:GlxA family transcriptional regulator n=1 Tax=Pseudovibrio sp. Ad26 TaxID=989410 RepID=UPI0007AEB9C8|nr:helix-turn-helix domain-containing protein [Pseudovibrio sp. Ad26]KZL05843.1 HTH-type transcriptional regulator CdhR [Pseudovibrio sp. Ad26]
MPNTQIEQYRHIDALVYHGINLLDLAGPMQAFWTADSYHPKYKLRILSVDGQPIETQPGIKIAVDGKISDWNPKADLLIPGGRVDKELRSSALHSLLQKAAARTNGERIISICSGALILADAGILDGKPASTHWSRASTAQTDFPDVNWQLNQLFVNSGNIYTSAGVTAGIDLTLHLIEQDLGSAISLKTAQELVVYLRRNGGQAQFSSALSLQAAGQSNIAKLSEIILSEPEADWTIENMAKSAGVSTRTLHRRLKKDVGATPAQFVEHLRLDLARTALLKRSSIKQAANLSGFGHIQNLRRAFQRNFGITPSEYMERFS